MGTGFFRFRQSLLILSLSSSKAPNKNWRPLQEFNIDSQNGICIATDEPQDKGPTGEYGVILSRILALRFELAVVFLFIVGLRIAAHFINPDSGRWMDHVLVYLPVSLSLLASDGSECMLIAFVIFVSGDHPSMFGLRRPRILPDTIWALIALCLGWIVWILMDLIPQPDWILPEAALPSIKERPAEVLVGGLSLFVGAATEELLFRGYFLARFTEVTRSIAGGVLLSSFAFGMLHMYQGPAGVISASLLGVVFSLVVVATKSIWPTAIAHFLMNAWWYRLFD